MAGSGEIKVDSTRPSFKDQKRAVEIQLQKLMKIVTEIRAVVPNLVSSDGEGISTAALCRLPDSQLEQVKGASMTSKLVHMPNKSQSGDELVVDSTDIIKAYVDRFGAGIKIPAFRVGSINYFYVMPTESDNQSVMSKNRLVMKIGKGKYMLFTLQEGKTNSHGQVLCEIVGSTVLDTAVQIDKYNPDVFSREAIASLYDTYVPIKRLRLKDANTDARPDISGGTSGRGGRLFQMRKPK